MKSLEALLKPVVYPKMSLENPQSGWMSSYNYTNSAINSWLGEEVRTFGVEGKYKRPGRHFRSDHSFEGVGAVLKVTILQERCCHGGLHHDRQTRLMNVSIFCYILLIHSLPSKVCAALRRSRWSVWLLCGAHWDYQKRSQFVFTMIIMVIRAQ